ncbi:MAG: prepilin-type N-terminal cleavage/methylation domain-containing protein [Patescibacteria group bacterium]
MKTNKKTRFGFSLIELIIYFALLSSVMLILTQILTSIIQARLVSEASSSIEQNAEYIMNRFEYDISRANTIIIPASYGVSTSSLQLTINGVTYSYSLNGGVLQISNNLGTDNLSDVLATVSNLQFTKIGVTIGTAKYDSIRVNFRLTSVATPSSGKEVKDYQITVAPR